ncbi:MAG: capsular biosynthesis protein [Acidobacteriaceae bacterium]|nr:capsular biosynthesis protein [Acidobacteriaceae bacterium]
MFRNLLGLVLLVASAHASLTVSGNVKTLAGANPASGYEVHADLQGCDTKDARVVGSYLGVERSLPPIAIDLTTGAFSTTLAGNNEVNCDGQVNVTNWTISIWKKGATTPTWSADFILNAPGPIDLNNYPRMAVGPPPIALTDYAVRNASNIFATGTQDFNAAAVTRPYRRLAFANFPSTCTAGKDFIQRSDPAVAGQILYVCNATGDGWVLVGDGNTGGGGGDVTRAGNQTFSGLNHFINGNPLSAYAQSWRQTSAGVNVEWGAPTDGGGITVIAERTTTGVGYTAGVVGISVATHGSGTTAALDGLDGNVGINTTGGGAVGAAFAVGAWPYIESGSVTDLAGVATQAGTYSGAVANNYGFWVQAPVLGATVTNRYGLKVDDQTGATNNFAISTGLGKVHFGDTVDVAAPVETSGNPVTFIGDSFTDLWNLPASFPTLATPINKGVSGDVCQDVFNRMGVDVAQATSNTAILLCGVNDMLLGYVLTNATNTGTEDYIDNIVRGLRDKGVRPALSTIPPCVNGASGCNSTVNSNIVALNTWIKNYGYIHGISVADYYPAFLLGGACNPAMVLADGLHPSVSGYAAMAPIALAALKSIPSTPTAETGNGALHFSTIAPTTGGQIPIYDPTATNSLGGLGAYVPGDPLVQGLFANLSTSVANPVAIGGYDTAGTPALHRATMANTIPNASDFAMVVRNIPSGTQAVSGTVTANAGTGTMAVSAASLPLPSGASTEATLALIKAKTDNLDVALSTRTKPADTQTINGTVTVTQSIGTNLHTVCDSGCSSSAGFADNATFTTGTTAINPAGGLFDDSPPTAVATGKAAAARITNNRALHTNLRNQAGTEIGTASNPLQVSLANTAANATAVKVDNSAVTQPVSGTVTANAGTGNFASTVADGANVTVGSKADAKSTATDTTAVSIMSVLKEISAMEQAPASRAVTNAGTFAVQDSILDGAVTASVLQSNVKQINGVTPLMGNGVTGTGSQRVTVASDNTPFPVKTDQTTHGTTDLVAADVTKLGGTAIDTNSGNKSAGTQRVILATDQPNLTTPLNTQDASTGSTGSAVPSKATYLAGNGTANLTGITVCDTYANFNISTATTTLIVTGSASKHVRICSISLVAGAADNVALISGTGATCGTGTTGMTGGTTAATGYNFAANGGIAQGTGIGEVNRTNALGDSVCAVTSAAVQLSGRIGYTIY